MAEVPAVSNGVPDINEIAGAQTGSPEKTDQDGFAEMLDNEKRKTLSIPVPSFNLQTLFSVPLNSSANFDSGAGVVATRTETGTQGRAVAAQKIPEQASTGVKSDKEHKINPTSAQDDQKVQQNKAADQAMQNISKALIGEMEITPQFFDAIEEAKESSATIGDVDINDLVSQIKDKIKFLQDGGKIELSMTLKPDGMGSILLSVTSNKGIVSINLYADSQTKRTLDDSLPELERALKSANIAVGDLKVTPDGRRRNNARENPADMLYNA